MAAGECRAARQAICDRISANICRGTAARPARVNNPIHPASIALVDLPFMGGPYGWAWHRYCFAIIGGRSEKNRFGYDPVHTREAPTLVLLDDKRRVGRVSWIRASWQTSPVAC